MEQLSRREFLKLSAAIGLIATGSTKLVEAIDRNSKIEWINSPDEFKYFNLSTHLPHQIRGIYVNSPFLYLADESDIDKHLKTLKDPVKGVTVFINDKYENSLGVYDISIISRVHQFAEKLKTKNLSLTVALFDGYTMRESWNPVYGGNTFLSPYAVNGEENFYRNNTLRNHFKNRARSICNSIKQISNLNAVIVANELRPPHLDPDDEDFIRLYEETADIINDTIYDIPVLSGVANPRFISENIRGITANTAHIYHQQYILPGLDDYLKRSKFPLVIGEVGFPRSFGKLILPIEQDDMLANLIEDVLLNTSYVDIVKKEVYLGASSLAIWKVDNYYDGFDYLPNEFHKTNKVLRSFDYAIDHFQNN